MKSGMSVTKFLRDSEGGVTLEFTLVFPVILLVTLGTVDVAYLLFDWSMANKAAFTGARTAVISSPVASGITDVTYTATQIAQLGNWCFDSGGNNINCPSRSSTCTPNSSSGGSCINTSYTFDDTAFGKIFAPMQRVFPKLQRQNVQILYETNGMGFVGQPNGLVMNVKVSIQNMNHQFYFIGGLARITSLRSIPTFATTLTSESMGASN
jgi:uncharacterized protein (UPF0333 family)